MIRKEQTARFNTRGSWSAPLLNSRGATTGELVVDVPGRSGILIHPANNARKELLGCIAPVTTITGPGRGSQSRAANEKLKVLVCAALDRQEKVFITIK